MAVFSIDTAQVSDIDRLLALYFLVYGNTYPYKKCVDRDAMAEAIESKDNLWLVARAHNNGRVIGSAIFEMDRNSRIGKLTGVVVDTAFRKEGIAFQLVAYGSEELLNKTDTLNSIYATTRTNSVGPQLMCLKAGYRAFGIFPNAHRLEHFESVTLLIRYREGVLAKRAIQTEVLTPMFPIFKIANDTIGQPTNVNVIDRVAHQPAGEKLHFEVIDAPQYVKRLFYQTFADEYDRFFPFHVPNIIAVSTNGEVMIFAYLNKKDGYCAIVAATCPIFELTGRVDSLLNSLHLFGVSYVETLLGTNRLASIQTLLDKQFLPSAIYPAMRAEGEELHDVIVLTRSMEPLNFRGMAVERQFKPYIDQYVNLWKNAHLDSLEVFDDYQ